jgi:hypothetical protein
MRASTGAEIDECQKKPWRGGAAQDGQKEWLGRLDERIRSAPEKLMACLRTPAQSGWRECKALVAPGTLTRRSLPGEEDGGDSHAASVRRRLARRQALRRIMCGFLLPQPPISPL